MQCHTLCWLSMFIMFGYSTYGDNVIARAGNLETILIMKLFSNMENDVKELRAEMKEQQTKYEEENSQLRENMMDLQAQFEVEPKTIYAQVQLLGENTMSPGQRVKFRGTIANIGEAFKTSQGYFEAPYNGTYLFTVNLCMQSNSWVVFRIVQDNNVLSESHPGDSGWHACASATAATYMRVGSKVWAEIDRVHGGVISSSFGISSFTGVFLNDFQKP